MQYLPCVSQRVWAPWKTSITTYFPCLSILLSFTYLIISYVWALVRVHMYITTSSYHCCQQSVAEHDGVVIEEDGHGLICQRQRSLELLHDPSEIVGGDEDNNKETEDQRLVKEHHLKGKRILCAFSPFWGVCVFQGFVHNFLGNRRNEWLEIGACRVMFPWYCFNVINLEIEFDLFWTIKLKLTNEDQSN